MTEFKFLFTTHDANVPAHITVKKHRRTIRGLNLLDAQRNLRLAMRREGRAIHAYLEWIEIPRKRPTYLVEHA